MDTYVNEEVVNDTAMLAMHRIASRALGRDPSLVNEAKQALERPADRFPDRSFVEEWRAILVRPPREIGTMLIRRDEEMCRLRLSSPFMMVQGIDLRDPDLRRRI